MSRRMTNPSTRRSRSRQSKRPVSSDLSNAKIYDPGQATAVANLWLSRDPECLLEGPAGTGKTMGLLAKVFACARVVPGMRALLVRRTRKSMSESVLVTLESKLLHPDDPCLKGPHRTHRHSYRLANKSEIVLGGMDNTDSVMSSEYDIIAAFEGTELTLDQFEKLSTRLRNGKLPYQQIIVDCNPGAPTHWLNQRANTGAMKRFISRHEHNPTLYRNGEWTQVGKSYITRLEQLTGHRLARLRHGKWVSASGLVYDCFDANVHLIERFAIPPHWRRIVSIDFGFNNPFVAQWWAIDGDGRMIRYREIYMSKRTVRAHAEQIKALSQGERIEAFVCDHDAEDRATLEENGIRTIAAKKEIKPGIEAVVARMTTKPRPTLVLMRDSLVERDEELHNSGLPCSTEEEIDCYQWPIGVDGKPQKELPVDMHNHGCDPMRYAERYVSKGTPPIVVPVVTTRVMDEQPTGRRFDRDDSRGSDNW